MPCPPTTALQGSLVTCRAPIFLGYFHTPLTTANQIWPSPTKSAKYAETKSNHTMSAIRTRQGFYYILTRLKPFGCLFSGGFFIAVLYIATQHKDAAMQNSRRGFSLPDILQ
jgi:hypothetical protein